MTEFLDPLTLDRKLAALVARWRRWQRAPSADGFDPTRLSSKRTLDAVRELAASDPFSPFLCRWLYRLLEQRVNAEALTAVHYLAHGDLVRVDTPEHGRFSRRVLLLQSLSDEPRRAGWCRAFLSRSEPLGQAVVELWERRREVAERAALPDLDAEQLPAPDIVERARAWLVSTNDLASELSPPDLAGFVGAALGRQTTHGWPARLSPRVLADWFGETDLLRSLDLDLGPLPDALGSASYLRGLAALGVAFREAAAPRHQPFVVAHDPYQLESHGHGALFALLPLLAPFARRTLGLGSSQLADHRRVVATTLLLSARWQALRVCLRRPALSGASALRRSFVEETEAFGIELPVAAAGAIVRLRTTDPARFGGLLWAAGRAQRLLEEHDDDWYRNPRAAEQLRAEADLSPRTQLDRAELDAGSRALRSLLDDALG